MNDKLETYVRFSLSDRIQHVFVIVTFTLLALTGLPQKYSNLDWAKTLVSAMGGIDWVRTVHHLSAVILILTCVYHVLQGAHRLLFEHARFEMWPRRQDAQDAVANVAYFLGLRPERPRFDRYNYMEKFEYWGVAWGMMVMALTGLALLFPTLVTVILPGITLAAAKSIHGGEALLAVSVIVLWHLFNTHLNPRVFPINLSIFTGRVSRQEMLEEHPLEYERETGETVPENTLHGHGAKSWPALGISAGLGAVLVLSFAVLMSWTVWPPTPAAPAPIMMPVARRNLLPPATPVSAAQAQPAVLWQAGQAAGPVADWSAEAIGGVARLEGVPPLNVRFTNLSGGEITSWLWNFGDGATSTEQNPQHTYSQCPGAKEMCTVSLTVCGPGGCATMTKVDHLWVSTKSKK
jgi:formate dehydrogenase subunit gamma